MCGPMVQYWNLILHLSICLCPLPTSFLFIFPALFCGDSLLYSPRVRVAAIFPIYSWVGRIFRHFNSLFQHDKNTASITNLWHLFRPNFSFVFSREIFRFFSWKPFCFYFYFYLYFFGTLFSFTRKKFLLFASCTWIFLVWEGVPGRNWTRLH